MKSLGESMPEQFIVKNVCWIFLFIYLFFWRGSIHSYEKFFANLFNTFLNLFIKNGEIFLQASRQTRSFTRRNNYFPCRKSHKKVTYRSEKPRNTPGEVVSMIITTVWSVHDFICRVRSAVFSCLLSVCVSPSVTHTHAHLSSGPACNTQSASS